jgi:hypothetical protein
MFLSCGKNTVLSKRCDTLCGKTVRTPCTCRTVVHRTVENKRLMLGRLLCTTVLTGSSVTPTQSPLRAITMNIQVLDLSQDISFCWYIPQLRSQVSSIAYAKCKLCMRKSACPTSQLPNMVSVAEYVPPRVRPQQQNQAKK